MKKILVVEDEYYARKSIVKILQESDLDIQVCGEAENGMKAIELLEEYKDIALVITDIQMQKMGGLELASYLHKHIPEIDVLILTAFENFDYAREALRYNVKDYIVKPIYKENLLPPVKKVLAVLLNQKIHGVNVYRSAFFIPVIVSYVSITMVWQWLYNEDYGLINAFLGQLGLYQPPWLTSEKWAMPSVIIMSIWKNLGFNAVILLAGVQGISSEIYESADIDGANVVQKFFKITMPLLKPTIVFVTIISMINSFQAFDQIYVMTKGGPGTATQVVSYLIYMNAFQYFKQGYASAMAYILFIIVFIASIVQLRFSERNSI